MSETKWKVDIQQINENHIPKNSIEGMEFENIKQKIKRIHKKKSGPVKQIFGPFENLFEKRGDGVFLETSVKPAKEITTLQGAELEGFTSSSDNASGGSGTAAGSLNQLKQGIESNVNNLGQKLANTGTTLNSLKNEISQILDELTDMDSSSLMYYGNLGIDMPPQVDMGAFENNIQNTLKNNRVIDAAKNAISSVATILKLIMKQFISKLTLTYKTLQYFMLNIESYMQQFITSIANGLTNNTATTLEISIFQDQTQKFCSILLVWMFIYNWYYIIFFLDDRDNIRWKFNADLMEKNNPLLYFLFGPSVRVLQWINWLIVDCSSKATKWISKPFIFFIMFFIFSVLVASNYQMTMITDFFNCFDHNFGNSIWVIFVILIVGAYTFKYLWDNMWSTVFIRPSIITILIGLILSVLYIIYSITINLPIGVVLLTTYFFFYSFLGIFIYEGFGTFSILPAISEDISFIHADLKAGDICLDPPEFSFSKIPSYIYKYAKKFIDIISAYMFEIVVLFILLGGIMTYIKNFNTAAMQKVSFNSTADVGTPVRAAFSQLFTWLILINVIIIILIVLFTVQKYNTIGEIKKKVDLKENIQDKYAYQETGMRASQAKQDLDQYAANTAENGSIYRSPLRQLNQKIGEGYNAITGNNPRTNRLVRIQKLYDNAIIEPDAKYLSTLATGPLYVSIQSNKPIEGETQDKLNELMRKYEPAIEMDNTEQGNIKLDILNINKPLEQKLINMGILKEKRKLEQVFGKAGSNEQNGQNGPSVEIKKEVEREGVEDKNTNVQE